MINLVTAVLLACQFVLICVMFWLDAGRHWPTLLLLSLSACGLAALVFTALWRLNRFESPTRREALVGWIDQVDIASDDLPSVCPSVGAQEPQLTESIQGLLLRLHSYRKQLQIRHQRVQRLLRNVTDVLYHADQDARLTWVSDSVSDMLGYTPDEICGQPLSCLLVNPEEDLPTLTQSRELLRHPTQIRHKDGSIVWLVISARRIDNSEGQTIGSEAICRDVTRLIDVQRQLDHEKERAQTTLAAIGDGVITTDAVGRIDYINPRGLDMLSLAPAQVLNRPFESVCHLFDTDKKAFVSDLVTSCLKNGSSHELSRVFALVSGQAITPPQNGDGQLSVTVIVSIIHDQQNRTLGAVVVLHDVTRLERASRELTRQANHDSLTGLLNRRAFVLRLSELLESARHDKTTHTLCYLDLDHFKMINDTCGHHAGDAMLCQLSSQLAAQLRPLDTLARLGGDEFGIIFESTELDAAQIIAERLCQSLKSTRFEWDNNVFRLGASFGLCALDETSISATELLRRTDMACYLAKEQGRNQVCIYRRDGDKTHLDGYQFEHIQHINKALAEQGFVLYAQPIVPLAANGDSKGVAAELLLRTKSHPELISTQSVLLNAERYNMASRVDRWVVEHALQLISQHRNDDLRITYYSINISGQSITDEQFISFARESIESSGVNPALLVFEITETAIVLNLRHAGNLMQSLRAMGCRFALDDFGSEVSSINYLRDLPFDFVKIDGTLVRHVTEDPIVRPIVEAICEMCKTAGQGTVAEQVETKAQLDVLAQLGVDSVQGYYLARPMPFDSFIARLKGASWRVPTDYKRSS